MRAHTFAQIQQLKVKYQHLQPKEKKPPKPAAKLPACVEVKLQELGLELSRLAKSMQFAEAALVKKRVGMHGYLGKPVSYFVVLAWSVSYTGGFARQWHFACCRWIWYAKLLAT